MRERRLLAALDRGERSREALLAEAWVDVPAELRPAAEMVMQAHLDKLAAEGRLPAELLPDPTWLPGQYACMMSGGRAVRTGLLAGAAGTGLAAVATAAAWHWLARRPLPKQKGTISLDGLEGRCGCGAIAGAFRILMRPRPADLWFAEGFCHGQTGSGSLTSTVARFPAASPRWPGRMGCRSTA